MTGIHKTYTSFDSVKDMIGDQYNYKDFGSYFGTEHLNSINVSDLPPHELHLKINSIIMLIRNINIDEGKCNGTRCIVTKLYHNVIQAKIISGM